MQLQRLTLTEMVRLVSSGQVSPQELLDAHLHEICETNPRLNAVCAILTETANPEPGPLHGLPVTIKDCFHVAGARTIAGSRQRLSQPVETHDAEAVRRLRAAGAVPFAKTNVPELIASYETDNAVYGPTLHPHDPGLSPGGSSGGEAAAIAAFCSPGGLASDGGGSIRVPAHFCGIVGFKPTQGVIPSTGMWPPVEPPFGSVVTPGPVARTVADVRLLFEALADPVLARRTPRRNRIGVMRPAHVDPAIAHALDLAASAFQQLGFQVTTFAPSGVERAPNLWAFFFAELSPNRELLQTRAGDAHWTATEFLSPNPRPSEAVIEEREAERDQIRHAMGAQMQPYDAILCAPCAITGFRPRERRYQVDGKSLSQFAAMAPATMWNLLGYPAIAMPYAGSGIQLAGHPFEDYLLLDLARQLEQTTQ